MQKFSYFTFICSLFFVVQSASLKGAGMCTDKTKWCSVGLPWIWENPNRGEAPNVEEGCKRLCKDIFCYNRLTPQKTGYWRQGERTDTYNYVYSGKDHILNNYTGGYAFRDWGGAISLL